MVTTESEVLVAISHIGDPAAREICRRMVNKMNILPFKVTDGMVRTGRNHANVSAWSAKQLQGIAPLLKSGARKGWPKGGLSAEIIEGIATMPQKLSPRPTKGLGLKTRSRNRTNIKSSTEVADMIDNGKVEWIGDILTPV